MPSTPRDTVKLNFPVRKSSRISRAKSKLILTEENRSPSVARSPSTNRRLPLNNKLLSSPRKRSSKKDDGENLMSSPQKVGRKETSRVPLSPVKNNTLNVSKQLFTESPIKENNADKTKTPVKNVAKQLFAESPMKNSKIAKGTDSPLKNTRTKTPQTPSKPALVRLTVPGGESYQNTRNALHTSLPDKLVCRDDKHREVKSFITGCVDSGAAGSLYISGPPGTGKTAVISRIIHEMKKSEDEVQTVYVNCMSVRNSQAIFNKVLSELKGKDTSRNTKEATKQLEALVTRTGRMICLVMDECDQLDSKSQEVLYTMFEWPALKNSRLILIGIANMLDLTERLLPRLKTKVQCKPKIINFPTYSVKEIEQVLTDRLSQVHISGEPVLHKSAISFCARKVSTVSGDMRKALDVCRRAVEIVEQEVKKQQLLTVTTSPSKSPRKRTIKQVGIPQILRVINEVYGSGVSTTEQDSWPLHEKLAVCSLLLTVTRKMVRDVTLGTLYDNYRKVCRGQNVECLEQLQFFSVCGLAESRGILAIKTGKEQRMKKVSLRLDQKELENTMKDKALLSSILRKGFS